MRSNTPPVRKPSKALIRACRLIARFLSRLFWRIEFHGVENIPGPDTGGFIIASNHQTYLDPVWISIPIYHDIRYLAWDRVFNVPLLGAFLRSAGAMPVNLSRGGTYSSLKISLKLLKSGSALVIFPEGEREFSDGELLAFKTGAVHLAKKSDVPILPVTINGANKVWPRLQKMPRFGKVDIYYHPPVKISGSIASATESLKQKINSALVSED